MSWHSLPKVNEKFLDLTRERGVGEWGRGEWGEGDWWKWVTGGSG